MDAQSTSGDLRAVQLEWSHCRTLALRLASEEHLECTANGHTPEESLAGGLIFGWARCVLRGDEPVGAYGFTHSGTIWSLWGHLSQAESKRLLREAPAAIEDMVLRSGRGELHNVVAMANKPAIAWIRATKCFEVDDCNPRQLPDGSLGLYFETTPFRRPPRV